MNKKPSLEQIQEVINVPHLANNIRGQIKEACLFLDSNSKTSLALDYAEHIAWVIEENRIGIRSSVLNTLELSRQYLAGNATIHEVQVTRIEAFYSPQFRNSLDKAQSMALLAAANAIYKGSLHETANAASQAAALYHAGTDWDSKDKLKRQIAHQLGQTASLKESQWQLAHLLDFIENQTK